MAYPISPQVTKISVAEVCLSQDSCASFSNVLMHEWLLVLHRIQEKYNFMSAPQWDVNSHHRFYTKEGHKTVT